MATFSGQADFAPLPGMTYGVGTMATADIYPTHAGIGGVTTQDRALPAFAEQAARRQAAVVSTGQLEGLMSTPAGWLAVVLVAVAVLAWRHRKS